MEAGIIKYWIVRIIIGAGLCLLGGWDCFLKTMIIFIIVDYTTGLIKAIYNQEISSKKSFRGFLKKLSYLLAIIVAVGLDDLLREVNINIPVVILGTHMNFRQLVIMSVIGNEGISIVENLGELGFPMPKVFKNLFKNLKETNNE